MKIEPRLKALLGATVMVLAVAELLLVLVSWLLSATMADDVRSLLSSEGIRWFVDSFTTVLTSPLVGWLLLLAMSGGCLWRSGLVDYLCHVRSGHAYRERVALRIALIVVAVYLMVLAMLTLVPHAVLLSATGCLWPSPFSRALVPILAFGVFLVAVVFGWASGRFSSAGGVVEALSFGIGKCAPLVVLYVFVMQLLMSLSFVFGCCF